MDEGNESNSSNNETPMSNKFVIILSELKLDVSWPIQLIIKYDYSIFSSKTFTTGKPIQAQPSKEIQDYKIPDGYREYTIMMTQTEMKIALNSNPFKIRLCHNNLQFGKATADLSKLFSPDADNMRYGKRYEQDVPIFGMNDEDIIGTISCTFVLETEICIPCKSCGIHFKASAILKHVRNKKDCRSTYTDEDIVSLQQQSTVRIKEKRNIRDWMKYNPEKRAKKHAKYYNPVKRAERHLKNLEQEKENKNRELETTRKRIFEETKKNMEKEATKKNFDEFERKKNYFQEAKYVLGWDQSSIPEEIEAKIESFEEKLFNLQSKLDHKIDKTSTFINNSTNLTLSNEIKDIWTKMKEKVKRDWQKLGIAMDQEFREGARQFGASDDTINNKFSSLCSYL